MTMTAKSAMTATTAISSHPGAGRSASSGVGLGMLGFMKPYHRSLHAHAAELHGRRA
jgi:hypothetical protein